MSDGLATALANRTARADAARAWSRSMKTIVMAWLQASCAVAHVTSSTGAPSSS